MTTCTIPESAKTVTTNVSSQNAAMEVVSHWRSSFRARHAATAHHNTSGNCNTSTDNNNNSSSNDSLHKKRAGNYCDLCGKRLLKLAK